MSDLDDLHPDLQALVGSVIHQRYRVEGLLGQGGMGAVFKGHHEGLRRDVAIKVLRPELGGEASTAKRFDREAHSVSRLDHPNCVRVTDFGTTEGGVKYLVMELLEGTELEAELGQPWAPARAVDTIIQMLEGLEHAHHFGIVHRDLKPENVFVTRDFRGREVVKLVDFGIAKLLDSEGAKEQLTRAGMVFGTPRYMSPEQASGGKLDERTDLYAIGLILYEMLAGHPPFAADEAAILLRMHILAPPPALPGSVPEALAQVVYKLLEKSRNDRYASAREVVGALEALRTQLGGPGPSSSASSPAPPGPSATPAESATGWQPAAPAAPLSPAAPAAAPAAPLPPPPGASGLSFAAGSAAAPARPPGLTTAATPSSLPPPPSPPPDVHQPDLGAGPNAPTHAGLDVAHPSMAVTSHEPVVAAASLAKPARPWLPWAITAGAIMLALMAFGAGQALIPEQEPSEVGSSTLAPRGDLADSSGQEPRVDEECRGEERCDLECGAGCTARCTETHHCAIEVGDDSSVYCDLFNKCEVECLGSCAVECPQGGCKVECLEDRKSGSKRNAKKKKKKAKNCGGLYLCGRECGDD